MKKFETILFILSIMFIVTLISVFMIQNVFSASHIMLECDAITDPSLAGYRLYESVNEPFDPNTFQYGAAFAKANLPVGTPRYEAYDVPDGMYYWRMTSVDDYGNESLGNNIISVTLDTTSLGDPNNFEIKINQKTSTEQPE